MLKKFFLGIIPARGGSKGIPQKNIIMIKNFPLIYYTIKAAKDSKLLDDFIVSTEDKKIVSLSIKFGGKVFQLRPRYLAQDRTPTIDVVKHEVEMYKKKSGIKVTDIVILQPTSPLRNEEDIDNAINIYLSQNTKSLISVSESLHCHPYYIYKGADNNRLVPLYFKNIVPRKDLPPIFIRNGAIYITNVSLIKRGKLITNRPSFYVMPEERSINLDTPKDLITLEAMLNKNDKIK